MNDQPIAKAAIYTTQHQIEEMIIHSLSGMPTCAVDHMAAGIGIFEQIVTSISEGSTQHSEAPSTPTLSGHGLHTSTINYLLTYLFTYLLTYLLTLWNRDLLEKLTGFHLVKKFPAFYGTRRFITAFTSDGHLSLS